MTRGGTRSGVLHQGPLPALIHGSVEYAAAALLIVAPFLFSFEDRFATAASIVIGLAILALTATSDLPTGLVRAVPSSLHATADFVVAALLVALPFVLGFRDEGPPTALFIALGVAHLLITIATRFPEPTGGRGGASNKAAG
ncbi:MAG: hypothetical protein M3N47_03715 [Chloroflexota bacterium]|nr:hypothetical protein [Chloroflexota bacterium]